MYTLPCLLLLVIVGTNVAAYEQSENIALTFELPDNDKMCFYKTFTKAKRYSFEYMVQRGGKNDVDASVVTPNGKIVYKETKKRSDQFNFESSRGDWKFCFSNEFSTITHKVVYFELAPEEHDTLELEAGQKIPTVHTQVEELMESIHEYSTQLVQHQTEYRIRESRGRYMADGLNSRVFWWSIGQSIVILLTGVGQVMVLKAFFSQGKPTSNSAKQVTP